jgi:hypothetical protein
MKIATLLIFLAICCKAVGQDSAANNHQLTKAAFGRWKLDGRKLKPSEFRSEIYKVPAAITFYKKAKTRQIVASSFSVPAIVFLVLSKENNIAGHPNYGEPKAGFIVATILSYGTSFFFQFSSLRQLKKAVGMYNENQKIIY